MTVAGHRGGDLLRRHAPGLHATDAALELLGFLEAELDADVVDAGLKQGHGLDLSTPILIRLESLEVELATDGSELSIRHVSGSRHEFEDLCQFIHENGPDGHAWEWPPGMAP